MSQHKQSVDLWTLPFHNIIYDENDEQNIQKNKNIFRKTSLAYDDVDQLQPNQEIDTSKNNQVNAMQKTVTQIPNMIMTNQQFMFSQKNTHQETKKEIEIRKQLVLQKVGPSSFKCNCKKTKCLKMYCECFSSGKICQSCNCFECKNADSNSTERNKAIEEALIRNIDAFNPLLFPQAKTQSNPVNSNSESQIMKEEKQDQLQISEYFVNDHNISELKKECDKEQSEIEQEQLQKQQNEVEQPELVKPVKNTEGVRKKIHK